MKKSILFFIGIFALFSSCEKKEKDCFDKDLYESRKYVLCPQDCPGVIGCDGKVYCNECIANSHGIRVNR